MKRRPDKWIRVRIGTIQIFFCLIAFLIAGRAFQLQVMNREELFRLAEKQYKNKIPLIPKRGTIYSRGYEELAVSVEVDSIYADPSKVRNTGKTARMLAATLSVSASDLEKKLASGKSFAWVARKVSPSVVEAVRSMKIEGIGFVKENKRFYPNSELAAHVVGFSGTDGNGLAGIEFALDGEITRAVEVVDAERDALGKRTLPVDLGFEDSLTGNSIVLTLDKAIQYASEKALSRAVKRTGAKGGTAIVMIPKTGEIVAMASYPQFNPNDISSYSRDAFRNKAITDTYEPGSTLKTFLVAAALEEGIVTPGERFYCENGSWRVANKIIHDTKKHGTLSVREILKYSSNIGTAKIGERVGRDIYYNYLTDFGFGSSTGLGLSGESQGLLRPPSQWTKVDLANISFGQGVSATPIQVATAFSAVANGGYMMKPYIVKEVLDREGRVVSRNQPQIIRKVISGETASRVVDMLKDVVTEKGTGTLAALESWEVAGKTGTSQKIERDGKGYSSEKHVSSFVGFAPAERPEIVVFVAIDEPEGVQYGGLVAGPAFKEIAETSLRYLNTPKDREPEIREEKNLRMARAE